MTENLLFLATLTGLTNANVSPNRLTALIFGLEEASGWILLTKWSSKTNDNDVVSLGYRQNDFEIGFDGNERRLVNNN